MEDGSGIGFRLLMGHGYELCYRRDFDAHWALLDRIFLMRYSYACEVFIWTLAMGSGVPEMRDGILFVELEAFASSEMNLRV